MLQRAKGWNQIRAAAEDSASVYELHVQPGKLPRPPTFRSTFGHVIFLVITVS